MRKFISNIAATLVFIAGIAVIATVNTTPAVASSNACLTMPGGFCAGESVNLPGGMSLAALQTPVSSVKIGVQFNSTSPVQDWYIHNPANPVNNDKYFELAPNGVLSGLCMSQPRATAGTSLVLRKCRQNGYQTFTAVPDGNGYYGWVNTASGDLFTVPNGGQNGSALVSRNPGKMTFKGGQWQFNDTPSLNLDAYRTPARVTHHEIGDDKGNGPGNLVMQGSGTGTIVRTLPSAQTPNQEYNIDEDTSACNNGIATSSCPFQGATPGDQVVFLVADNGSGCINGTLNSNTKVGPCSGVSGVDYERDGWSLDNAYATRNNGNGLISFACATGNGNNLGLITGWSTGVCQWGVATF